MNFFQKYKSPLAVVSMIILLGGMFVYQHMQVSLFPEITFPKIKIIAEAGQMPVDQMMLSVTRPIELAVKKVPELTLLRSTTSRGSCEMSAFMDWKGNIDVDQQRIQSRIDEIKNQLPPDIDIQVERMNPSILPVSGYALESPVRTPIEMRILAEYTVKPFLSEVDGVSEIRVIGGKRKEYQVELNLQKMSSLGLTPEVITTAVHDAGFIKSNGYLSDYRMMYLSVTNTAFHNKSDLENLVISNNGKRIILLKDIATIDITEAKEYIRINTDGRDGILIAVIKQPDANLITLSQEMQAKVDELQKALPKDVTLKPYYIQERFVSESIRSVTDSLWIGLLLAIMVVVAFLHSWKASATILLTIPITLFLTAIVLYATGQTLNIMTLGAIAASIGLIIDDAIVVVEQIHRTHEEHPEIHSKELVGKAISYLFPAMVGSSLSTIVIFLPFALMTGVAGAYFKVMTNSMVLTLVCSFFVTWLILPVIYLLLTRKEKGTERFRVKQNPRQQRLLRFFITRPWISFIIVLVFMAGIYFIIPKLETGFLPDMDEGSIVLDYSSPPGSSLEETDRILREVEKIIVANPDVETYSRRTGTQMGFFITEPNRGDYLIQLKRKRGHTTEEVIQDLRVHIEATQPALRIDFGQVIGDMLGDLMASVQPIEIKIFGNDRQKLEELATQAAGIVEQINGTADVFDGIIKAGPSISVEPDKVSLAQFGITPANFQNQIQTSLEGVVIGSVNELNQYTDIRMSYPGHNKLTVEELRNQGIFLSDGKLKPIGSLARVDIQPGEAEIERENLQSMGIVTGRLTTGDLGKVMNNIQREISKINLPQGYHVAYGGAYAEQQQSFRELLIILITSCLLVFTVVLFLFRKINLALTVLFLAVLGITGSLVALYFTHTPLNVGSYTGLIMITGIIGENAIFTILQFRESLREGKAKEEAVIYSISARLRPNLMTAFGAIIALMPIALGIGAGAQLHQPLAIAVIGGFVCALPLLLLVLPTFLKKISITV